MNTITPDCLLSEVSLFGAMQSLFALEYASAVERHYENTGDRSLLPPASCRLDEWAPRRDAYLLLKLGWYLIGRIESAWNLPVGLVFHHAGIRSDEQQHALTDLFLGCQGHGVTLGDDFDSHIAIAEEVFGREFDLSPIDDEMDWLSNLAEEALAKNIAH